MDSSSIFSICDTNTLANFICETQKWPLVHIVNPFLFYFYFRNLTLNFLLIGFWEFIEGSATVIAGNQAFFVDQNDRELPPETAADSTVGDWAMGFLGTMLAFALVRLFEIPHFMPPAFPALSSRYFFLWLKYFFQLLLFVLPNGAVAIEYSFGSLGYLIMIFYIPGLFMLFSLWNMDDPLWKYKTIYILNKRGEIIDRDVHYKQIRGKSIHRKFQADCFTVAIILGVFIVIFFYQWSSMFIMGLVYGGGFNLLFWGIYLVRVLDARTSGKTLDYEQMEFFNAHVQSTK